MPPPCWEKLRYPGREGQAFHLVFLSYPLFLLLLYEHPGLSVLSIPMCFCYRFPSYKLAPFQKNLLLNINLYRKRFYWLLFRLGQDNHEKPIFISGLNSVLVDGLGNKDTPFKVSVTNFHLIKTGLFVGRSVVSIS